MVERPKVQAWRSDGHKVHPDFWGISHCWVYLWIKKVRVFDELETWSAGGHSQGSVHVTQELCVYVGAGKGAALYSLVWLAVCVCARLLGIQGSAFHLPGLGGAEPQQAPTYQHEMRGDPWVLETTKFSSSRLGRTVGPNFPGFGSLKQSQVSSPAVSVPAKNPQAVQKLCGGFRVTLNQLTASWIFYSASEFSFIL